MGTVFFYNFILLASTFFVFLSEKGKGALEYRFFLSIAFLIVYIPAAIRYGVGSDFFSYETIYNHLEYFDTIEPGYYFLNWILRQLNADTQWVFALTAFVYTVITFIAYPKRRAWILHFILMALFWYFSFNGIRQALAVAFCLVATFKYFQGRYIPFIIWTLLGSLFHLSALFFTLSGLLALLPIRNYLKANLIPTLFIGFIGASFISTTLITVYIELGLSFLGFDKYTRYFGSSNFMQRDFGSGIGVLIKIIISVYVIANTRQFLKLNKNYWLVIIITFIYAIATILANNIVIFGRMQQAFIIAPVVGIYLLSFISSNRKIHKAMLSLALAFLLLSFMKDGLGIKTSYGNPHLNPYQTFLSK